MNETQRAAAERLADDLQRFDGAERESLRDEAAALLRELLAEPVINQQMTTELAEPVQEPVALMWQHEETGRVTFTTMADPYVGKRWHRIPLYPAAPQQPMHCPKDGGECGAGGYCRPEPQQRKPLSDEQVRQIVVDASTSWAFKRDGSTSMRIARAIECAHGITGEPT